MVEGRTGDRPGWVLGKAGVTSGWEALRWAVIECSESDRGEPSDLRRETGVEARL